MKFATYTLGCKVNHYDTQAMAEKLLAQGYTCVEFDEIADVYLINTCTVTNTADKKSRNIIRRAIKKNKDAVVCVCGCLSQRDGEELAKMLGVSAVIGTDERANIVQIVQSCMQGKHVFAVNDISQQKEYEELSVKTSGEQTRGTIKIQEGCNNFCSYCIIPYVRGRVRSRSAIRIIDEAKALAQKGIKEIVLTGIHISSYGQDNGEELFALIGELNNIDGILRIRLGSIEPHILTADFLRKMAEFKKVCPHFHVSLQSGSDSVLVRMNRKYTSAQFAQYIENIRDVYENPAITTDIITGFPGETEEEFLQTCDFAWKVKFSRIHVFPYSQRDGTVAAAMKAQIPQAVRKQRAGKLIQIAKELENRYINLFIGTWQDVLFEQYTKDGFCEGYTDRYLRVHAKNNPNEYKKVLLKTNKNDMIIGETE
ncbi:MAG: tRNA (N(6)-L-threonylcarbamoyladenosine(37)-C(2))-methylthiotransferase MtaB [Christensenellaceae bacterium]